MASLNKVQLIGNLGADPDARFTANGTAVTTFSLATTYRYKDKDGTNASKTDWHRVKCSERLAENAAECLRKGSPAYVEGRLSTRKWTDKDRIDHYVTEVIASDIQFLGRKESAEQPIGDPAPGSEAEASSTPESASESLAF